MQLKSVCIGKLLYGRTIVRRWPEACRKLHSIIASPGGYNCSTLYGAIEVCTTKMCLFRCFPLSFSLFNLLFDSLQWNFMHLVHQGGSRRVISSIFQYYQAASISDTRSHTWVWHTCLQHTQVWLSHLSHFCNWPIWITNWCDKWDNKSHENIANLTVCKVEKPSHLIEDYSVDTQSIPSVYC